MCSDLPQETAEYALHVNDGEKSDRRKHTVVHVQAHTFLCCYQFYCVMHIVLHFWGEMYSAMRIKADRLDRKEADAVQGEHWGIVLFERNSHDNTVGSMSRVLMKVIITEIIQGEKNWIKS